MAKGINIPVHGDVRPLMKDIDAATKRPLKLKPLDSKSFSAPLGKIRGEMGEFQKSLEASNARVLAFGASAGAIVAVQQAFRSLVSTTMEVEKSLAEVNVILGTNSKNLRSFGNELFSIAKNTQQSFNTVAVAATELARQGLGLEQTLKRTSDAMILTRLSGLAVTDSVESITAALNGFNSAALNSTQVINKIIAVDQAFAVSGKDLAESLKRVGSTAQDAGVSIDQLMAVVTTAQQITARGGAVIGNSFKTIFTRIQRPKVLEALNAVGVATRDLSGNQLSAIKVLQNLAKQFDSLAQSQKSQIAELVGGVFQINVLKAALSDLGKQYSIYDRALNISIKSSDEAARRNAMLNKTLAASFNELVVNLQQVGATVGKLSIEPVLRRVFGGLNKALSSFDGGEADGIGQRIGEGIFKGIGEFLKGPALAMVLVGVFKMFDKLRVFAKDAFKTIAGVGQAEARRAELQKAVVALLQKEPGLIDKIKSGTMSVKNVHDTLLARIDAENKALIQQEKQARKVAKALARSGVTVKQTDIDEVRLTRGKSQGFIPSFSRKAERIAAMSELASASYAKPTTRVIKAKQPGSPSRGGGTYLRNSEETITRVAGAKQHFVNPPENSKEGRKHKINSIMQTGINPYKSSGGFVPSFGGAHASRDQGRHQNKLKILKKAQEMDELLKANPNKSLSWGASKSGIDPATVRSWVKNYAQGKGKMAQVHWPRDLAKRITKYSKDPKRKIANSAQGQKNALRGRNFEDRLGNLFGIKQSASTRAFDFTKPNNFKGGKQGNKLKQKINMLSSTYEGDAHVGKGHESGTFIGKFIRHSGITPTELRSLYQKGSGKVDLGKTNFVDVMGAGSDVRSTRSSKWLSSHLMKSIGRGFSEENLPRDAKLFLNYQRDRINLSEGFVPNYKARKIYLTPEQFEHGKPVISGGGHLLSAIGKDESGFLAIRGMNKNMLSKLIKSSGYTNLPNQETKKRDKNVEEYLSAIAQVMGVNEVQTPIGKQQLAALASSKYGISHASKHIFKDAREENTIRRRLAVSGTLLKDIPERQAPKYKGKSYTYTDDKRIDEKVKLASEFAKSHIAKELGVMAEDYKGSGKTRTGKTALSKIIPNWEGWKTAEKATLNRLVEGYGFEDYLKLAADFSKDLTRDNRVLDFFPGELDRMPPMLRKSMGIHPSTYYGDAKLQNTSGNKISLAAKWFRWRSSRDGEANAQQYLFHALEKGGFTQSNVNMPGGHLAMLHSGTKDGWDSAKVSISDLGKESGDFKKKYKNFFRSDGKLLRTKKEFHNKKINFPFYSDAVTVPDNIKELYQNLAKDTQGRKHIQNLSKEYLQGVKPRFLAFMQSAGGNRAPVRTASDGYIPNFALPPYGGYAGGLAKSDKFAKFFNQQATNQQWGRSDKSFTKSALKFMHKMGWGNYGNASWASMIEPSDFSVVDKSGKSFYKPSSFANFLRMEDNLGHNDGTHKYLSFMGVRAPFPSYHLNADDGSWDKWGMQAQLRNGTNPYSHFAHPMKELVSSLYSKTGIQTIVQQYNKKFGAAKKTIRIGFNDGYIPNFANPLSTAIGRESSAVPKGKIRVGQDNRLKSAKNPAGLGVFNTRDEPRGLGQGISRAKKEGKNPRTYGASNGFVPNYRSLANVTAAFGGQWGGFGAATASSAGGGKKGARRAEKINAASEAYASKLFQASFTLGTLSTSMGSLTKDIDGAQEGFDGLAGAITNAGTVAQLIPGPMGKLASKLVFVGGAMNALAKFTQRTGGDVIKEAERLKGVTQTATDALGQYGKAFSDYTNLIQSGSTDVRAVSDAQQKMAKALMQVPPEIRSQIQSSKNLTDLQNNIAKATVQMGDRKIQTDLGATLAKKINADLGIGDVLGRDFGFGTNIGKEDVFKGGQGKALLDQLNVDMGRTLNLDKMLKEVNELGKSLDFAAMSGQGFVGTLRNQYGLTSGLASILEGLNDEELKKLQRAFQGQIEEAARSARINNKLSETLSRQARETNRLAEATQRANNALKTLVSTGLTQIGKGRERATKRREGSRALMLERAKGGMQLGEAFLPKDLQNSFKNQAASLESHEKYLQNANKVLQEGRNKLISAVADITKVQPKSKGSQGKTAEKQISPQMLSLQKNLITFSESTKNLGFEEFNKALNTFVRSNRAALQGSNIGQKQTEIMAQTRDALLDLKMEQMQQTRIANLQTSIQAKLLQQQKDLKVGGGIDKFLDPKAQFQDLERFSEALSNFTLEASQGRSRQETARQGLQLSRSITGFLGGAALENPEMRGVAIQGRAENIRNEASQRIAMLAPAIQRLASEGKTNEARSLQRLMQGLSQAYRRSGSIAQTQVLGELKTRKLPEEIANMVSELKTLNRNQQQVDTKIGQSLQTAIQASNMPNLLGQIHQAAVDINNSIIAQEKQKKLNEAEVNVQTAKEQIKEAKGQGVEARKALQDFWGNDLDIDLAGAFDLELSGKGEQEDFRKAMEQVAKIAVKQGQLAEGAGIEGLKGLSEAALESVFHALPDEIQADLTGGKFMMGGLIDAREIGSDFRDLFAGLSDDSSGFGDEMDKLIKSISVGDNVGKSLASLNNEVNAARQAMRDFRAEAIAGAPEERKRAATSGAFGRAATGATAAKTEKQNVTRARGSFNQIMGSIRSGDAGGAAAGIRSLMTGNRGEAESQLRAIAQATGMDASQLIAASSKAFESGGDRRATVAGGRQLQGMLGGVSPRAINTRAEQQYLTGLGTRESAATARGTNKRQELIDNLANWEASFKNQFGAAPPPWAPAQTTFDKGGRLHPENKGWSDMKTDFSQVLSARKGTYSWEMQMQELQRARADVMAGNIASAQTRFGAISDTSQYKRWYNVAKQWHDELKQKNRIAASGYVPQVEESMARSLGAPNNVKAHMGKGLIQGKRFMMNNHESEIRNFMGTGESAVIPHYSKGFMPGDNKGRYFAGGSGMGNLALMAFGLGDAGMLEGLGNYLGGKKGKKTKKTKLHKLLGIRKGALNAILGTDKAMKMGMTEDTLKQVLNLKTPRSGMPKEFLEDFLSHKKELDNFIKRAKADKPLEPKHITNLGKAFDGLKYYIGETYDGGLRTRLGIGGGGKNMNRISLARKLAEFIPGIHQELKHRSYTDLLEGGKIKGLEDYKGRMGTGFAGKQKSLLSELISKDGKLITSGKFQGENFFDFVGRNKGKLFQNAIWKRPPSGLGGDIGEILKYSKKNGFKELMDLSAIYRGRDFGSYKDNPLNLNSVDDMLKWAKNPNGYSVTDGKLIPNVKKPRPTATPTATPKPTAPKPTPTTTVPKRDLSAKVDSIKKWFKNLKKSINDGVKSGPKVSGLDTKNVSKLKKLGSAAANLAGGIASGAIINKAAGREFPSVAKRRAYNRKYGTGMMEPSPFGLFDMIIGNGIEFAFGEGGENYVGFKDLSVTGLGTDALAFIAPPAGLFAYSAIEGTKAYTETMMGVQQAIQNVRDSQNVSQTKMAVSSQRRRGRGYSRGKRLQELSKELKPNSFRPDNKVPKGSYYLKNGKFIEAKDDNQTYGMNPGVWKRALNLSASSVMIRSAYEGAIYQGNRRAGVMQKTIDAVPIDKDWLPEKLWRALAIKKPSKRNYKKGAYKYYNKAGWSGLLSPEKMVDGAVPYNQIQILQHAERGLFRDKITDTAYPSSEYRTVTEGGLFKKTIAKDGRKGFKITDSPYSPQRWVKSSNWLNPDGTVKSSIIKDQGSSYGFANPQTLNDPKFGIFPSRKELKTFKGHSVGHTAFAVMAVDELLQNPPKPPIAADGGKPPAPNTPEAIRKRIMGMGGWTSGGAAQKYWDATLKRAPWGKGEALPKNYGYPAIMQILKEYYHPALGSYQFHQIPLSESALSNVPKGKDAYKLDDVYKAWKASKAHLSNHISKKKTQTETDILKDNWVKSRVERSGEDQEKFERFSALQTRTTNNLVSMAKALAVDPKWRTPLNPGLADAAPFKTNTGQEFNRAYEALYHTVKNQIPRSQSMAKGFNLQTSSLAKVSGLGMLPSAMTKWETAISLLNSIQGSSNKDVTDKNLGKKINISAQGLMKSVKNPSIARGHTVSGDRVESGPSIDFWNNMKTLPDFFNRGGRYDRLYSLASGYVPEYHTGGVVPNFNVEQPSVLLGGEGVVNQKGMKALGKQGLNALNKGQVPNFAFPFNPYSPQNNKYRLSKVKPAFTARGNVGFGRNLATAPWRLFGISKQRYLQLKKQVPPGTVEQQLASPNAFGYRQFMAGDSGLDQDQINAIIAQTPHFYGSPKGRFGNPYLGGDTGRYFPGSGQIHTAWQNPSKGLLGHERFHAVAHKSGMLGYGTDAAAWYQQRDKRGYDAAAKNIQKVARGAYGGMGSDPQSLIWGGANELAAYAMMGGASGFANNQFDPAIRKSSYRQMGPRSLTDRDYIKATSSAAKLMGGGDFFKGMMMMEGAAKLKYLGGGYVPNFDWLPNGQFTQPFNKVPTPIGVEPYAPGFVREAHFNKFLVNMVNDLYGFNPKLTSFNDAIRILAQGKDPKNPRNYGRKRYDYIENLFNKIWPKAGVPSSGVQNLEKQLNAATNSKVVTRHVQKLRTMVGEVDTRDTFGKPVDPRTGKASPRLPGETPPEKPLEREPWTYKKGSVPKIDPSNPMRPETGWKEEIERNRALENTGTKPSRLGTILKNIGKGIKRLFPHGYVPNFPADESWPSQGGGRKVTVTRGGKTRPSKPGSGLNVPIGKGGKNIIPALGQTTKTLFNEGILQHTAGGTKPSLGTLEQGIKGGLTSKANPINWGKKNQGNKIWKKLKKGITPTGKKILGWATAPIELLWPGGVIDPIDPDANEGQGGVDWWGSIPRSWGSATKNLTKSIDPYSVSGTKLTKNTWFGDSSNVLNLAGIYQLIKEGLLSQKQAEQIMFNLYGTPGMQDPRWQKFKNWYKGKGYKMPSSKKQLPNFAIPKGFGSPPAGSLMGAKVSFSHAFTGKYDPTVANLPGSTGTGMGRFTMLVSGIPDPPPPGNTRAERFSWSHTQSAPDPAYPKGKGLMGQLQVPPFKKGSALMGRGFGSLMLQKIANKSGAMGYTGFLSGGSTSRAQMTNYLRGSKAGNFKAFFNKKSKWVQSFINPHTGDPTIDVRGKPNYSVHSPTHTKSTGPRTPGFPGGGPVGRTGNTGFNFPGLPEGGANVIVRPNNIPLPPKGVDPKTWGTISGHPSFGPLNPKTAKNFPWFKNPTSGGTPIIGMWPHDIDPIEHPTYNPPKPTKPKWQQTIEKNKALENTGTKTPWWKKGLKGIGKGIKKIFPHGYVPNFVLPQGTVAKFRSDSNWNLDNAFKANNWDLVQLANLGDPKAKAELAKLWRDQWQEYNPQLKPRLQTNSNSPSYGKELIPLRTIEKTRAEIMNEKKNGIWTPPKKGPSDKKLQKKYSPKPEGWWGKIKDFGKKFMEDESTYGVKLNPFDHPEFKLRQMDEAARRGYDFDIGSKKIKSFWDWKTGGRGFVPKTGGLPSTTTTQVSYDPDSVFKGKGILPPYNFPIPSAPIDPNTGLPFSPPEWTTPKSKTNQQLDQLNEFLPPGVPHLTEDMLPDDFKISPSYPPGLLPPFGPDTPKLHGPLNKNEHRLEDLLNKGWEMQKKWDPKLQPERWDPANWMAKGHIPNFADNKFPTIGDPSNWRNINKDPYEYLRQQALNERDRAIKEALKKIEKYYKTNSPIYKKVQAAYTNWKNATTTKGIAKVGTTTQVQQLAWKNLRIALSSAARGMGGAGVGLLSNALVGGTIGSMLFPGEVFGKPTDGVVYPGHFGGKGKGGRNAPPKEIIRPLSKLPLSKPTSYRKTARSTEMVSNDPDAVYPGSGTLPPFHFLEPPVPPEYWGIPGLEPPPLPEFPLPPEMRPGFIGPLPPGMPRFEEGIPPTPAFPPMVPGIPHPSSPEWEDFEKWQKRNDPKYQMAGGYVPNFAIPQAALNKFPFVTAKGTRVNPLKAQFGWKYDPDFPNAFWKNIIIARRKTNYLPPNPQYEYSGVNAFLNNPPFAPESLLKSGPPNAKGWLMNIYNNFPEHRKMIRQIWQNKAPSLNPNLDPRTGRPKGWYPTTRPKPPESGFPTMGPEGPILTIDDPWFFDPRKGSPGSKKGKIEGSTIRTILRHPKGSFGPGGIDYSKPMIPIPTIPHGGRPGPEKKKEEVKDISHLSTATTTVAGGATINTEGGIKSKYKQIEELSKAAGYIPNFAMTSSGSSQLPPPFNTLQARRNLMSGKDPSGKPYPKTISLQEFIKKIMGPPEHAQAAKLRGWNNWKKGDGNLKKSLTQLYNNPASSGMQIEDYTKKKVRDPKTGKLVWPKKRVSTKKDLSAALAKRPPEGWGLKNGINHWAHNTDLTLWRLGKDPNKPLPKGKKYPWYVPEPTTPTTPTTPTKTTKKKSKKRWWKPWTWGDPGEINENRRNFEIDDLDLDDDKDLENLLEQHGGKQQGLYSPTPNTQLAAMISGISTTGTTTTTGMGGAGMGGGSEVMPHLPKSSNLPAWTTFVNQGVTASGGGAMPQTAAMSMVSSGLTPSAPTSTGGRYVWGTGTSGSFPTLPPAPPGTGGYFPTAPTGTGPGGAPAGTGGYFPTHQAATGGFSGMTMSGGAGTGTGSWGMDPNNPYKSGVKQGSGVTFIANTTGSAGLPSFTSFFPQTGGPQPITPTTSGPQVPTGWDPNSKWAKGVNFGGNIMIAARGYAPNFALSSAIGQALSREKSRMPEGSMAKVGFDPRVGVGVYNTSEGSLSNAIDMHMATGRSMSEIQKAGSASYRASVPNYNLENLNTTIKQMTESVAALSSLVNQKSLNQGGGAPISGNTVNIDNSELVLLMQEVVSGITGLSETFDKGMAAQAEALNGVQQTVTTNGNINIPPMEVNVTDASAALVRQLQSKMDAILKTSFTPAQQGEINMLSNFNNTA